MLSIKDKQKMFSLIESNFGKTQLASALGSGTRDETFKERYTKIKDTKKKNLIDLLILYFTEQESPDTKLMTDLEKQFNVRPHSFIQFANERLNNE